MFEYKYGLITKSAAIQDVMRDIKEDIKLAFMNYIDPKTVTSKAYNAIPVFATRGEAHCLKITGHMQKMVDELDTLIQHPAHLFAMVNKVLALIDDLDKDIKETKTKSHPSLPSQQALHSYRNDLKRLEESLRRFSSMMVKQAKRLQKFLPDAIPLEGGVVESTVVPLSKEQLLLFLYTPLATKYGLNRPDIVGNLDILEKMFNTPQYEGMRQKFETMIRALKRGHVPKDGPEVAAMAKAIRDRYDQRSTNEGALDRGTDLEQEQTRYQQMKQRNDQKFEKIKSLDPNADFMDQQNKQEEERKQREIEQDRERLIRKYEG